MDERAKKALSLKVKGLVGNCVLGQPVIFDSETWARLGDIDKLLVKAKGKWVANGDIYAIFFKVLREVLPDFTSGKGSLVKLMDGPMFEQSVLKEILGIPYIYNIYYEFPGVKFINEISSDFCEKSSFCRLDSNFVKGVRSTVLGGEVECLKTYYYRAKIEGYIGELEDGEAINSANALLKVFLERSFSAGLFSQSHQPPRFGDLGTMFIHLMGVNGEVVQRTSLQVGRDLAHVLMRVGTIGRMNDITQEEFDDNLESFRAILVSDSDLAKKILVASEWRFDSVSEAVAAMGVVKVCIGLESLYGDDASEGGITKSLADRCAYSLGVKNSERATLSNDCKSLYKLRSKIVHGVLSKLTGDDRALLSKGQKILQRSIAKEISML
jgi:hypothetical protein